MPYVPSNIRDYLDMDGAPRNSGELNYQITQLLIYYWHISEPKSYQRINDILGALEGAKLEFYRRVAVPYEDKKIIENGDVY